MGVSRPLDIFVVRAETVIPASYPDPALLFLEIAFAPSM